MRMPIMQWLRTDGKKRAFIARYDGQRGAALTVFMVILGLFLFGMAALGVDAARLWLVRTQMKNAMDAAALAGASGLMLEASGTPPILRASRRATDTVVQNVVGLGSKPLDIDKNNINVSFSNQSDPRGSWSTNPPASPSTRFIQVTGKAPTQLFLRGVLNFDTVRVAAQSIAGFSDRMVTAVPPNTTPIIPVGVMPPPGSGLLINRFQCAQSYTLVFVPPATRGMVSGGLPGTLDIYPLNINPSDTVQRMYNYIAQGYMGGTIKVGGPFIEFARPDEPTLELDKAINEKFDSSIGRRRDLDSRQGITYSTNPGQYNDAEPRTGNGRRILLLPIVRRDLPREYTVVAFGAFFLKSRAYRSPDGRSYFVPVEFICNYAIPNGTLDSTPLAPPPYRAVTRLQLTY